MLDEIRLRKCVSEEVNYLNHDTFSKILSSLKSSIEPTVYHPIRKIYIPEFYH